MTSSLASRRPMKLNQRLAWHFWAQRAQILILRRNNRRVESRLVCGYSALREDGVDEPEFDVIQAYCNDVHHKRITVNTHLRSLFEYLHVDYECVGLRDNRLCDLHNVRRRLNWTPPTPLHVSQFFRRVKRHAKRPFADYHESAEAPTLQQLFGERSIREPLYMCDERVTDVFCCCFVGSEAPNNCKRRNNPIGNPNHCLGCKRVRSCFYDWETGNPNFDV